MSQSEGVSHLKKAVSLLEEKMWPEALAELDKALEKAPVVGDYALFYRAGAFEGLGDRKSALLSLQRLLSEYPESSISRKAKSRRLALLEEGDELVEGLRGYLKEYPSDDDAAFRLALILKKKGIAEEADGLLVKLFIGAGSRSAEAFANMGRQPTGDELLQRTERLLRAFRYKEAEAEIRVLLAADGADRQRMLNLLGRALFAQKRYVDAANAYLEASNAYEAARCFYRLEDEPAFSGQVESIIGSGDERAASLLTAQAARKRRNGDFEGALSILKKVLEGYPGRKEDALWELGWLRYLKRDYPEAFAAFSELALESEKPAYLYWKARAIEALGGDAGGTYEKLASGDGFYAALSWMRITGQSAGAKAIPASYSPSPSDGENGPAAEFLRADLLIEAGLREEAVAELARLAEKSYDRGVIVRVSERLKDLGAYRRAMLAALRLPEDQRPKGVLYPAAFRRQVERESERNGLDPYLLLSLMREESRFDPGACSPAGALGLMQLMPATAERLSKPLSLNVQNESHIYDVENNIAMGAYYLGRLIGEFRSVPQALAAYNAGEGAVRKWLSAGSYSGADEFIEDIPYGETKNYVKRIITTYFHYKGEKAAVDGLLAGRNTEALTN
jgi:soluble lytic murein transglycosylase